MNDFDEWSVNPAQGRAASGIYKRKGTLNRGHCMLFELVLSRNETFASQN